MTCVGLVSTFREISTGSDQAPPANQAGILINRSSETASPVDNLELAHFLHLLREHDTLRSIISASTGKLVLLLGGFNDGGLERLRALGDELKARGYLPVIFDFERPNSQSYTDTVEIVASLARFVVADLTGPSVPFELTTLITHHMIPFVLIWQTDERCSRWRRILSSAHTGCCPPLSTQTTVSCGSSSHRGRRARPNGRAASKRNVSRRFTSSRRDAASFRTLMNSSPANSSSLKRVDPATVTPTFARVRVYSLHRYGLLALV